MWYSPSLQQLLFLEAVLEEGGFVRAADRLHTTHSTISRSLKALSNGLGINLFDKTPYGLKLSSVGRIYGRHIRKSLEQAKPAFDLARYETTLHQRPFCVGHSPYMHGGHFARARKANAARNGSSVDCPQRSRDSTIGAACAARRASRRFRSAPHHRYDALGRTSSTRTVLCRSRRTSPPCGQFPTRSPRAIERNARVDSPARPPVVLWPDCQLPADCEIQSEAFPGSAYDHAGP